MHNIQYLFYSWIEKKNKFWVFFVFFKQKMNKQKYNRLQPWLIISGYNFGSEFSIIPWWYRQQTNKRAAPCGLHRCPTDNARFVNRYIYICEGKYNFIFSAENSPTLS